MTRLLLPLLACLFLHPLMAQTDTAATGLFNQAAHRYVKQDRLAALRTLDEALRKHPDDPRLLKLAEELLKEQQQQQQQQQQDQQKQDQQKQDQQKQEQQQQDQQQQKQDQKKQNEQPGQRTDPREAQRLLDALEQQEKGVQEKVRLKQRPAKRALIERDW
ncbi:MAG: hypothetical protein JNM31_05960 [Flavobacteriales bacterium]|nr:hypothetical protein [Flavobacteriales bacterium]